MLLGLALAVLGTAVFAFPDTTMHNPGIVAFLPMLVAAMLLAAGIVVVVAEIKIIWLRSHSDQ